LGELVAERGGRLDDVNLGRCQDISVRIDVSVGIYFSVGIEVLVRIEVSVRIELSVRIDVSVRIEVSYPRYLRIGLVSRPFHPPPPARHPPLHSRQLLPRPHRSCRCFCSPALLRASAHNVNLRIIWNRSR